MGKKDNSTEGRKITATCVVDIESLDVGFKNKIELEVKGECWCDRFTYHIGRIESGGNVKSYLKRDDENGNIDILTKIRENIELIEIPRTVCSRDDHDLKSVVDLFLLYKIDEHSSNISTVIDEFVDNISNVTYDVEYEVLFVAGDGWTRYLTVPQKTRNMGLVDFVEDLEELLEEYIEDGTNGFREIEDYDGCQVQFYDEAGYSDYLEFSGVSELLSMVNSVRMIKCESKIID